MVSSLSVAVAGAAVFLWLLPRVDPDAVIRQALDQKGAIEAARTFLEQSGLPVQGFVAVAQLRRDSEILNSLQRTQGRNEATRLLQRHEGPIPPAYVWEIDWRDPAGVEADETRYEMLLSPTGSVSAFENKNPSGLFGKTDRDAIGSLRRAGARDAADLSGTSAADSVRRSGSAWSDALGAAVNASILALRDSLDLSRGRSPTPRGDGGRASSGAEGAVALARYHVARSALAGLDLQVDSLWFEDDRRDLVTVRFVSRAPFYGHDVAIDAEVTAFGVLVRLQPSFDPADGVKQPPWWKRGDLPRLLSILWFAALLVVTTVVFFRRFGRRNVDTGAALRDGLVMGLIAACSVAMLLWPSIRVDVAQQWLAWIAAGISAVFAGLGVGLLTFLVSGTSDGLARESMPERLHSLTLIRRAYFSVRPLGLVVLRGLALGFGVAALWAVALRLLPGLHLDPGEEIDFGRALISPFLASLSFSGWSGYLLLSMVFLGAGAVLARRSHSTVRSAVILTLLLALFSPAPFAVEPLPAALGSDLALSAVFVWAFLRWDFLTVLLGYALFESSWSTAIFWLDGSGLPTLDGFIAGSVVLLLVAYAVVALAGGRSETEVPTYVPGYLIELARNERMARELEIARQVQTSFLPRRMPEIKGLDLAAVCLAANEVGGDYYDFVQLSESRLALIVGDVSGKGFQAAFYMTLAKGFFRTLCREITSPAEVLRRMNRLFWENADRGTFISLIYGILDLDAGSFTFARAGHNPVILKRSPSQIPDLIRPAGLALGLVPDARFDDSMEEHTLLVRTGDVLVFYTDGFSEARRPDGELFGDQRLAEEIATWGRSSAGEILERVTDAVQDFMGRGAQSDDMTMVVVRLGRAEVTVTTEQPPTA